MISFDFEYYQPTSTTEALTIYENKSNHKKRIFYYSGGTEFISRARRDEITADVVIDIKEIPECTLFHQTNNQLQIGAAHPLSIISKQSDYPLLANIAASIATRTERNKITIGGNLMSHLPYKEMMMPLLVADAIVHTCGAEGQRTIPISDFASRLDSPLNKGEWMTSISIPLEVMKSPFLHIRETKQSALNYPLVSLVAILHKGKIRLACSGLCAFPFRSAQLEEILNDHSLPIERCIQLCAESVPGPILDDIQGSKQYRSFMFQQGIRKIIQELSGKDATCEK